MNLQRLLCVIGLLLLGATSTAHALRCGNRLVTDGDFDFQVRARCGNPYWVEDHFQMIVAGDDRVEVSEPVEYSAWYFNFGANRLLMRLLFRDGRLVREDALDRGVSELGSACAPARLREGISSGELVAYCGEPASRHMQSVLVSRHIGAGLYRQSDGYREDWLYDFGDDFVWQLHLSHGRVESVERVAR